MATTNGFPPTTCKSSSIFSLKEISHSHRHRPFTLAGTLNLVDFAPSGSTIQALAVEAVNRMMSDWLLFLNEAGAYYPVAARNKNHWYFPVFHAQTWVLTGRGVPVGPDNWKHQMMGQFMALTSFNFDALEASWEPVIDRVFSIGHGVEDLMTVHGDLPREERVLYQWTAGYVVQAETVNESLFGVRFYELIGSNLLFDMLYTVIGWIPDFMAQFFFSLFPGQTQGTGMAGAKVHLYKNNGVVLTSLEDYFPGTRGFEQFPWVATVHDIAVFTQAGPDGRCLRGEISNTHLPNIVQEGNVALISYKPRWDVRFPFRFLGPIIGFNLQVALAFPYDQFDEVAERGNWIVGRKENSYIGVWRYNGAEEYDCSRALANGDVCDQYYFSRGRTVNKASVWAVVVGNNETHGSFDNFVSVVEQGTVQESSPSVIETFLFFQGFYRTGLTVDGTTLSSEM